MAESIEVHANLMRAAGNEINVQECCLGEALAAEAGIQLATTRLSEVPPNLSPIDVVFGGGKIVQSRTRTDTAAQPLAYAGSGPPPEGYGLASGGGAGFSTDLYQVNITASADSTSQAEIEARLGLLGVGGGGY